jgi:hypothetical protein
MVDLEHDFDQEAKKELRHPTLGNAIGLWACRPFAGQRTGSWSEPVRLRAVDWRGRGVLFVGKQKTIACQLPGGLTLEVKVRIRRF